MIGPGSDGLGDGRQPAFQGLLRVGRSDFEYVAWSESARWPPVGLRALRWASSRCGVAVRVGRRLGHPVRRLHPPGGLRAGELRGLFPGIRPDFTHSRSKAIFRLSSVTRRRVAAQARRHWREHEEIRSAPGSCKATSKGRPSTIATCPLTSHGQSRRDPSAQAARRGPVWGSGQSVPRPTPHKVEHPRVSVAAAVTPSTASSSVFRSGTVTCGLTIGCGACCSPSGFCCRGCGGFGSGGGSLPVACAG